MQEKTERNETKTVRKCVRMTKDMDQLFSIIAKEHDTTVGKYLRDAGMILAEMAVDEKEILELIKDKDKLKVKKKFEAYFQDTQNLVINSIGSLHEYLTLRLDRIEKVTELFLYVFLFLNPSLTEHQKEDAVKSAVKRKREILKYVDQLVEKMQKERDGEQS